MTFIPKHLQATLRILSEYIALHGRAPNDGHIGTLIGRTSSCVSMHREKLAAIGLIKQSRLTRLTPEGVLTLAQLDGNVASAPVAAAPNPVKLEVDLIAQAHALMFAAHDEGESAFSRAIFDATRLLRD